MRYLVALLLPFLSFFTMGMPVLGLLCLILQMTVIGWLPAAVWALFVVHNYNAERRTLRGPYR